MRNVWISPEARKALETLTSQTGQPADRVLEAVLQQQVRRLRRPAPSASAGLTQRTRRRRRERAQA